MGGAFGHITHPFNDHSLTFNDLENIVERAFEGKLDIEATPVEKTDGMNIMVSWIDGQIVAARNKGNIKHYGKDALSISELVEKYEGRGTIRDAFEYAINDLSIAFQKLPNKLLDEIFRNGKRFMSLEIIYPEAVNVIPYDRSLLVFHGNIEYDTHGNAQEYIEEHGKLLSGVIQKVNADVQKYFTIIPPPKIELKDLTGKSFLKDELIREIKRLRDRFNLKGTHAIRKYHEAMWSKLIDKIAINNGYDVPDYVKEGLIKRWVYGNKSGYSLREIKSDISNDNFLNMIIKTDRSYRKIVKEYTWPFEMIFTKLAVEVLKHTETPLVNNKKLALEKIINTFEKKVINSNSDISYYMNKLDQIGGIDAIVASEGIVFRYNGDVYKLTGAFSTINRIMGFLRD